MAHANSKTRSVRLHAALLLMTVGGCSCPQRLSDLANIVESTRPCRADTVLVRVPYPGASPMEVEQGILLAVEEATSNLKGAVAIESRADEGFGQLRVRFARGTDLFEAQHRVKDAVDRIVSFPQDAERPIVFAATAPTGFLMVAVSGDVTLTALATAADQVRDDLRTQPGIGRVERWGVPPREIEVRVSRSVLGLYQLRLNDVADAVRRASIDLSSGGGLSVRTRKAPPDLTDLSHVVLRTTPEGTVLKLGDVAEIRDGFAAGDRAFLGNVPAVLLRIPTPERRESKASKAVEATVRGAIVAWRRQLPDALRAALIGRVDVEACSAELGLTRVRGAVMGEVEASDLDAEARMQVQSQLVAALPETVRAKTVSWEADERIHVVAFDQSEVPAAWATQPGAPVQTIGPAAAPTSVTLFHPDSTRLLDAEKSLASQLRREGLRVFTAGARRPSIDFQIDRAMAARAGVTSLDVARQLRASMVGIEATRFQQGNEEVRVMVRTGPTPKPEELGSIVIETPAGLVPMQQLGKISVRAEEPVLRIDGRRARRMVIDASDAAAGVEKAVADVKSQHPGLEVLSNR